MYLKPEPGANFMIKLGWNCPWFRLFWSLSSCFVFKSLLHFRLQGHMERKHIILAETLAPWYLTGPDLMFKFHEKFGIHGWEYPVSVWRENGTDSYVSLFEIRWERKFLRVPEIAFRTHNLFVMRNRIQNALQPRFFWDQWIWSSLILFDERDRERYRDMREVSYSNDVIIFLANSAHFIKREE